MTNNSIHRRGAEGAEGEYSGVLIHRLPRFHRFLDHRGNGDLDDHGLGGRGIMFNSQRGIAGIRRIDTEITGGPEGNEVIGCRLQIIVGF